MLADHDQSQRQRLYRCSPRPGVAAVVDWTAFNLLFEQDEDELESFFLGDMASLPTPWDAPLPGRPDNVVADQAGYGDGGYPVYGGFAARGELVAVHVDFDNAALTTDRFSGGDTAGR